MSAHSAHVHNPTNPIPRLPHRPGRILLGGAAVIGGIFAGTWFYMSMKHARKANREPGERGALPSWEYRILQAVDPARGSGSGSGTTRPNNTPHASKVEPHALSSAEEALCAENGAKMRTVPQREQGDGLADTKR
ncbi:hypothetical protein BJV74DRAFT_119410 [Russula compacta]|nr:hypothetical protein BJV74DRAFT_119410 [Russula compacta]